MRFLRLCFVILLCTFPVSAFSQAGTDWGQTIDAARGNAMELVGSGQHVEAASLLLNTLRSIPPERTDLAYPGLLATIQQLLFTNEYLMSQQDRAAFYDAELNEPKTDMDRFIWVLMWYVDDFGITQEQANDRARDLLELSNSKNQLVQLGALFVISDPYYFKETPFALKARDRILRLFPDSYLAHEAQRLGLYYYANRGGAKRLLEAFEQVDKDGNLYPHTIRLRTDPIGKVLYEAIKNAASGEEDAACVVAMGAASDDAAGWSDKLAALNVLAAFANTSLAQEVKVAATRAIEDNGDIRCVFRARALRMIAARNLGDRRTLKADTEVLLEMDNVPASADRMYLEDFRNSVEQSASYFAECGEIEEAQDFLQRLAARFPNTELAEREIGIAAEFASTLKGPEE